MINEMLMLYGDLSHCTPRTERRGAASDSAYSATFAAKSQDCCCR